MIMALFVSFIVILGILLCLIILYYRQRCDKLEKELWKKNCGACIYNKWKDDGDDGTRTGFNVL